MSEKQGLFVKVESEHEPFEVEPSSGDDLGTQARAILRNGAVHRREDGSFTIYPPHRIEAVHVGALQQDMPNGGSVSL